MERRTFLKLGLGGTLALAVGGAGLALQRTVMVEPRGPLLVLSPRQFSVLHAVAERMCPGVDGLPTPGSLGVAEQIDLQLSTMHPGVGHEIGLALLLIENGLAGLMLDGRARTFTALGPAEQTAVLESWRTSRLHTRRMVFRGLQKLVSATFWGSPETFGHTGYAGPPDYRGLDVLAAAEAAAAEAEVEGPVDEVPVEEAP